MIRNAISRLMCGRYGRDELGGFLLLLYFLLYVLSLFTSSRPLAWVALGFMLLFLFRALSRNFSRRREENARFLKLAKPLLDRFRLLRTRLRDKDHRYFKCPSCGQQLRVPRGKGKINVTCRNCGAVFQEKS